MSGDVLSESARIAELNDEFRKTGKGGRIIMTRAVADLSVETITRAVAIVKTFNDFNEDNDPYGEHDFFRFEVAGETFFSIVNWVHVSEDLFTFERRINDCLIQCLGGSLMTDLACGIMDINDFSYLFILNGSDDSANPIENEDLLNIRILTRYLENVFHFFLILG